VLARRNLFIYMHSDCCLSSNVENKFTTKKKKNHLLVTNVALVRANK